MRTGEMQKKLMLAKKSRPIKNGGWFDVLKEKKRYLLFPGLDEEAICISNKQQSIVSLPLSLTLTHTYTHTLTYSISLTPHTNLLYLTYSLSLSLFLTLTHTHKL